MCALYFVQIIYLSTNCDRLYQGYIGIFFKTKSYEILYS